MPSQGSINGSVPQEPELEDAGVTVSLEVAGTTVALEDDGCTVSLEVAGTTVAPEDSGASAELVGSIVELTGSAEELLDSSADEMASMRELLTGSWLSGISTVRLELFGALSTWLELFGVSGELTESGTGSAAWSDVGLFTI